MESHRRQGIATALVRAGMKAIRDQGAETVCVSTVIAAGILEGFGWKFIQTVIYKGEPLALYRCTL